MTADAVDKCRWNASWSTAVATEPASLPQRRHSSYLLPPFFVARILNSLVGNTVHARQLRVRFSAGVATPCLIPVELVDAFAHLRLLPGGRSMSLTGISDP
jgi:hypothetical protein